MTKILALLNLFKFGRFLISNVSALKRMAIYAAIATAVGVGAYYWHTHKVEEALQVQRKVILIEQERKYADLLVLNQMATDEINRRAAENERKKNEEILRVTRSLNTTIAGLRDRATRAEQSAKSGDSNSDSTARVTSMCTGAELARDDAEFLARYSAGAERMRVELIALDNKYRIVYEELQKLKKGNSDAVK